MTDVESSIQDLLDLRRIQNILLWLLQSPADAGQRIALLSKAMTADALCAEYLAHWLLLLAENAHRLTGNAVAETCGDSWLDESMNDLLDAAERHHVLRDGEVLDLVTAVCACPAARTGLDTPVSMLGDLEAPERLHRVLTALALIRVAALSDELGVTPLDALGLALREF